MRTWHFPFLPLPVSLAQAIADAVQNGQAMADGGRASMTTRMKAHVDAIDKTGIGLYFGDKSAFFRLTAQERQRWITSNQIAGTTPGPLQKSSCIEWAMEHVGAAYAAAGMGDRWNTIAAEVARNDWKGTVLARELRADGWQSVYYNPDTKRPADGNPEHPFSARLVEKGSGYYGVPVDHQVVNYRRTDAAASADTSGLDKLRQVTFFFGLARGGEHTFVGQSGRVNEFHYTAQPNDRNAIEETALETFPWNSGLIMVPPGTWPSK